MPADAQTGESFLLAFVLLNQATFPNPEQLVAALQRRWGPGKVSWVDSAGSEGERLEVRTLLLGSDSADIVLMPMPVPWSDLEGPCATARFWPEATRVCRAHQAHLMVALRAPGKDRLDQHLNLTHLIAAVVQVVGAPAVYWGNGTVVHSGEQFVRFAQDADRSGFPVHLWVDIRVFQQNDGSMYAATTGLEAFGLKELEGSTRRLSPRELFEKLFDLSHYMIRSGPVIRDGDTVGGDQHERIVARFGRSVWPREGQVIRLEFDAGGTRRGAGSILDFFRRKR